MVPTSLHPLLYAIMAHAAFVSTHEEIIGHGAPPLEALSTSVPAACMRSWGQRRAEACALLQREAFQVANKYSILSVVSDENAAALYLLDGLNARTGEHARPLAPSFKQY